MYRIYYSDGTTYEGSNPPPRDVQIILQKNEEGEWHLRSGGDYYILRDGIWIEVDIFGLFDYLMDSGIVLFGEQLVIVNLLKLCVKHSKIEKKY